MKRVGALLGAVVMVLAALAVRGTFGSDGDGGGSGDATARRLVCVAELRTVCAGAGPATFDEAGATADALLSDDGEGLDDAVWIVPAAWAQLVMDERSRLGLEAAYEIDGEPLASSPVSLIVWSDRAEQLTTTCGGPVDWTCLAEQDGVALTNGDRVQSGAPPVDSATGLAVAAAQAADLLGTSSFAANDFTGEFNSQASRLAAGQRDDPVRTMRTQGPGRLTAAGVVSADAANLTTTFGEITTLDTGAAVRVDIVAMVPTGNRLDDDAREAVQGALLEAGWDPPAGGDDGLPAGGVLAALRTFWNENR